MDQITLITGLPRPTPNANQRRSIPIKIMELIRDSSLSQSIPLNTSQCRLAFFIGWTPEYIMVCGIDWY